MGESMTMLKGEGGGGGNIGAGSTDPMHIMLVVLY